MILFVFEGGKSEPMMFKSLHELFLTGEDVCTVCCKNDLPTLYSNLKKYDYDLFRSLPLKENGIEIPEGVRVDTLFSQIFLFFDYDFQNRIGLSKVNEILSEMLEFFDDETDNGKLYINYPMVESLKYTKELPDANYWRYIVSRETCLKHQFKGEAESFAYAGAKGYRFIDVSKMGEDSVRQNWKLLEAQNVCKANYIVSGEYAWPKVKSSIGQGTIFKSQKEKYVDMAETVSILNSFPLFLYEYLR